MSMVYLITPVTPSPGMLTPSSSITDFAKDFACATTCISNDDYWIPDSEPDRRCIDESELDHADQDVALEFYRLEYADNRSQERAKDRLRKQRTRNLRHKRADQKRDNPSIFWQTYKCCEICARLNRKSSVGRKLHDRGNERRSTTDNELMLDSPGLVMSARWDESLSMELKWYRNDHDPWHWEQQEREYWAEEQFIERWFDSEYEFPEVKDPLPFHYTWNHYREREAAIRAWLGCTFADFWIPYMNDERQLKQNAKCRHDRAAVPGWVGEKYYDLTPTMPKSKTKKLMKASIQVRRDRGNTRLPLPVLPTVDRHAYGTTSLCGSDFEVLSFTEECSSDCDWEEVIC